jgi:hypothetical protein
MVCQRELNVRVPQQRVYAQALFTPDVCELLIIK